MFSNLKPNGLFNFPRSQGVFWEPGVLQFFLNFFLFLSIKNNKNKIKSLLIAFSIIITYSTAGYVLLLINILYFILKRGNYFYLILTSVLGYFFIVLLIINFENKIYGDESDSTLGRNMDALIAIKLISMKPLLGHGFLDYQDINASYDFYLIKREFFSKQKLLIDANLNQRFGLTNDLLNLFVIFGIPVALYFLYKLYHQNILELLKLDRVILFILILLGVYSEPILMTPFFYILFLSSYKFT